MNDNGKNMTDLQLVIMAAGMGSRYGGLKQVDEFGPGHAYLMDYAIYDAYQLGVRRVGIVVRESFRAQIEERMRGKWAARKDLRFEFHRQDGADLPAGFSVPEGREKPWGTAHVLYVLQKHVRSPFVIMNADDFYGRAGIRALVEFLRAHPEQHALAGYPLRQTLSPHGPVTRGVCEVRDGELKAVDEVQKIPPDDTRDALASMNLWGFAPSIFARVEAALSRFLAAHRGDLKAEYQIPHLINDLLREGQVRIKMLPVNSPWFGVTYHEDKEQVQRKIAELVQAREYPADLFQPGGQT